MAIYKLGEIGEFKGGISTLNKNKYDSGINFINYMDVFNNFSIDENVKLRKYDASDKDYEKHNVIYGDALFTASSETAEEIAYSSVYLVDSKAILNGFCKRFRFNNNILLPKFARYLFRSENFRKIVSSYATGYTRFNISQENLKKVPIEIPNIKDQQKIIDIIEPIEDLFIKYPNTVRLDNYEDCKNDVQKLIDIIEPIEKLLESTNRLTELINLFISKTSYEINNAYKAKKVGDLCKIKTGKRNASFGNENGKYKFFTCSRKDFRCDDFSFEGKSVLLAGNGDVGATKYYNGKFDAYQRTYVIQSNDYIGNVYLAFKKNEEKLKNKSSGSVIKYITLGDVENVEVSVDKNLNKKILDLIEFIQKLNTHKEVLSNILIKKINLLIN